MGFSQWRNRFIRREVESLERFGCLVFTENDPNDPLEVPGAGLKDEWFDGIWQRLPNRANIRVTDLGNDSLQLGEEVVHRDEFEMRLAALQNRLESLGAKRERISLSIDGQAPYALPSWLKDLRKRTSVSVWWGDSGTSTYGQRD